MNRITLAGAALLSLTAAASSQCWLPGPTAPGAVATTSVRALLRHDDGSGSKLYVGGLFDVFGGVDSGGLAVETPNGFAAVGGRRVAGDVRAMVEYGGDLIVGGQFSAIGETQAANLARWDGENWSPLGLGTDGLVAALAVYGGDLYAAGYFQNAGGAPASRIARWNGATWSAVGSGVDANVDALAVYQGDLFAAGAFLNAGGSSASRIAKWNGTSWASLSTGLGSGAAFALQVFDADGAGPAAPALFVGGGFYSAGGLVAHRVAAWDGSAWSAPVPSLGFSTSGAVVYGLGTDGASLFIGGSFVVGSAANVVKFASGAVSTLVLGGDGAQSTTYAFVHDGLGAIGSGGSVVVGGDFTSVDGVGAFGGAICDGATWTPLSNGFSGDGGVVVDCAVQWNGDLVVGGRFDFAPGGVAATNIATKTSSGWAALGLGLGDGGFRVHDLVVHGGDLYAAYNGYSVALGPRSRVAKWDGATWITVADVALFNQEIYALESLGGLLYAAGRFTSGLGGPTSPRVAAWNGTTWSGVGVGFAAGTVEDLIGFGGELYACGSFTASGATTVDGIARFDGAAWQPLGSGLGSYGLCLAVHDDGGGPAVFVGGGFTTAGGVAASRIAKWNGVAFVPVAGGFNPGGNIDVTGLASGGGVLYATGSFTTAGGTAVAALRAARLTGGAWHALGVGLTTTASNVVATSTGAVFVGNFAKAGGFVSFCFAEWAEAAPIGGPALFSFDPPTLPKQPQGGAAVLVVANGSNFADGTTFHVSGVPIAPIAATCSSALLSLDPSLVPQIRRDGALAIVAVAASSARSAAVALPTGFGATSNNQGLIVRSPFGAVGAGSTVQYSIEGGTPGGALVLLVDPLAPLPIPAFPDATSNFAIAVGPFSGQASAMFPLFDGFGVFGAFTPTAVLDGSGSWTSPPVTLPFPAFGFAATLQAAYADVAAPSGFRATFALWPEAY